MIEDYSAENELIKILKNDYPDVEVNSNIGDSSWGKLINPKRDISDRDFKGLRIVLFVSYIHGHLALEVVKKIEEQNNGRIKIVGIVTDDPADPHAKISKKRRIWRLYGNDEIVSLESSLIESAIVDGIPVYTGSVKTNFFRSLLKQWNPDAIVVSVFGQIIDSAVINYPEMGIYNFHPADLLSGFGAGPQPYQDLIDRDAKTTKMTVFQIDDTLDEGHIIGQSSPINVRYEDGSISDNILIIQDKIIEVVVPMTFELVKTLILKKEEGIEKKIGIIDFSRHFPEAFKEKLMNPVKEKKPIKNLPEIHDEGFFKIASL